MRSHNGKADAKVLAVLAALAANRTVDSAEVTGLEFEFGTVSETGKPVLDAAKKTQREISLQGEFRPCNKEFN